jgi:hypothetical protein
MAHSLPTSAAAQASDGGGARVTVEDAKRGMEHTMELIFFYQYSFHCAVPKEGNGSPENASSVGDSL